FPHTVTSTNYPLSLHDALPILEATAFESVMNFPRPVGREKDVGPVLRGNGAELGNGDLKIRQHLEQKSLELHVGAIDLVDQKYRDRKSTRLNSSHGSISYAVFC